MTMFRGHPPISNGQFPFDQTNQNLNHESGDVRWLWFQTNDREMIRDSAADHFFNEDL